MAIRLRKTFIGQILTFPRKNNNRKQQSFTVVSLKTVLTQSPPRSARMQTRNAQTQYRIQRDTSNLIVYQPTSALGKHRKNTGYAMYF